MFRFGPNLKLKFWPKPKLNNKKIFKGPPWVPIFKIVNFKMLLSTVCGYSKHLFKISRTWCRSHHRDRIRAQLKGKMNYVSRLRNSDLYA